MQFLGGSTKVGAGYIIGMSTQRWEGSTKTVCRWTQFVKGAGHSIVNSTFEDAEASECQICDQ